MRIYIRTALERKKPEAGDEQVVNGVTYIRQLKFSRTYNAYVVSNGRPVWEWVVKGSAQDRSVMRQKDGNTNQQG